MANWLLEVLRDMGGPDVFDDTAQFGRRASEALDSGASGAADVLGPIVGAASIPLAKTSNALGEMLPDSSIVSPLGEWLREREPLNYQRGDWDRGIAKLRGLPASEALTEMVGAVAGNPVLKTVAVGQGAKNLVGASGFMNKLQALAGGVGRTSLLDLAGDVSAEIGDNRELSKLQQEEVPRKQGGAAPVSATKTLAEIVRQAGRGDVITLRGDEASLSKNKAKGVSKYSGDVASERYGNIAPSSQVDDGTESLRAAFEKQVMSRHDKLRTGVFSDTGSQKQAVLLQELGIDPKQLRGSAPDLRSVDNLLKQKAVNEVLQLQPSSARKRLMQLYKMDRAAPMPDVAKAPVEPESSTASQQVKDRIESRGDGVGQKIANNATALIAALIASKLFGKSVAGKLLPR